jgi:hypothetical protein
MYRLSAHIWMMFTDGGTGIPEMEKGLKWE